VLLCGTMFGLGTGDAELWRHRLFESPVGMLAPTCSHRTRARVCGVYGGHGRDRRDRRPAVCTVTGGTGGMRMRDGTQQFSVDECREAMGIDWMTGAELSQAIPPAYTELVGRQLLRAVSP
jgi:DNA (cytosine-5)-methyltransferase 1